MNLQNSMDSLTDSAGHGPDLRKARRRRPSSDVINVDRLPPHTIESEQGVLCCVLLSPREVMPQLQMAFQEIGEEVFYDLRHQTLYRQMVAMHEKQQAIDILTLMQRLKDCELLEQIGGVTYLNAIQDAVPSAANASYYIDHVREKWILRKMIHTCTDVVGRVYESDCEWELLMDECERDILAIRKFQIMSGSPTTKELVRQTINIIEDFIDRKGSINGIPTGFADLDKMTGGLKGGEVTIIAARPSMGKTSLAMNIADHVAVDLSIPVGVFSLEMASQSLMMRMICSRARVNLRSVEDGFLSERDFTVLTSTAGKIHPSPLYIDDTGGLSIMELRARARRMVQEHSVKLLVVDYLQLLKAFIGKKRIENRQQEISEISGGLKELAKELNIPVIVLAQLSREVEKHKRKPMLSDLRESGSLEQDGDLIILLYKETRGEDDDDDFDRDAIPVGGIIAKQRNGPTGEVHLTFLKTFTRFESAAKVSDEDIPSDAQGALPV